MKLRLEENTIKNVDGKTTLLKESSGYEAKEILLDSLIAYCQRHGLLSTNEDDLLDELSDISGIDTDDISYEFDW